VEERLERTVRNEALLRAVNERVEELSHGVGDGRVEFLCECGRDGCEERIRMTSDDYERVHADDDRFALAPGHQTDEIERVVERRDGYWIVDKRPDAEKLLPRHH
jgi:hypothetical protein